MPDLLRIEHLEKNFGGIRALNDVSFNVEEGKVCALMGENGAGKSTLGKIIAGVERPDGGALFLGDAGYAPRSPLEAQRAGIAMIFQELDLFPNQTIAQNFALGNLELMGGKRRTIGAKSLDAAVRPWLSKVGLDIDSTLPLGSLSIAHIQLVSIARALSMEARLLVMDEPTSALTEEATEILFGLIDKLKAEGVTIVYVSHKMDEIFRIADSIVVMRDGAYIGTREREETDVREIISMMVGRPFVARARQTTYASDRVTFSMRGARTDRLAGVDFDLRAGEILGIAGLVGSGRTELGRAVFGMDRLLEGSMELGGRPYAPKSPRGAMAAGVGLIPEDRKKEGLLIQQSVGENMAISVMEKNQTFGFIRNSEVEKLVSGMIDRTRLKTATSKACVNTLSGGNQQKALVCRWLLVDPEVLFLDDPTRGVDVGAKEDIYEIIEALASRGKGILFVSSELPELLRCADRIMVMHQGRPAGIVDARATDQQELMRLAMGYAAADDNGKIDVKGDRDGR